MFTRRASDRSRGPLAPPALATRCRVGLLWSPGPCHTDFCLPRSTVISITPAARPWRPASCWSSWSDTGGIAALDLRRARLRAGDSARRRAGGDSSDRLRASGRRSRGAARPRSSTSSWSGVRVTLLPTAHSRADRAPNPREAAIFLDLAEQVLERFRPAGALDLRRAPGLPRADAPRSGQERARRLPPAQLRLQRSPRVRRRVGGDLSDSNMPGGCTASRLGTGLHPYPLTRSSPTGSSRRTRSRRYVTFVNPQVAQGAAVVARIALELGRPPARDSLS